MTFDATAARACPPACGSNAPATRSAPAIAAVPDGRAALRAKRVVVFGLEADARTVLVLGGSQGALRLNELSRERRRALAGRGDLQFLVATGPAHEVVAADIGRAATLLVRVVGSIDRMDLALAVADLAVSRAGAGHVAELAACGVPTILVPYPHATEHHQEANARELEGAGAAEVATEAGLTRGRPRSPRRRARGRRTETRADGRGREARGRGRTPTHGSPTSSPRGGWRRRVSGSAGRWRFWTPPAGSIPTLPIPSLEGVALRPPHRDRRARGCGTSRGCSSRAGSRSPGRT